MSGRPVAGDWSRRCNVTTAEYGVVESTKIVESGEGVQRSLKEERD